MNISGHEKAEVLMVLYNRAMPQGMSYRQYTPQQMTLDEARAFLKTYPGLYFDYVKGRVMKVDLASDHVDTGLYNRDNGRDAAEDAWLDHLTAPKKA